MSPRARQTIRRARRIWRDKDHPQRRPLEAIPSTREAAPADIDELEALFAREAAPEVMTPREFVPATVGTSESVSDTSAAPVIEVAHLHKAYGTTIAVEDVSLTVRAGEIFGILGRNGAGKTTTVECLTGLRTADRGTISVLGLDPRRDGRQLHERVGVQLQHSALPERMKVGEAVELYASFYRRPADGGELLAKLGLEAAKDQYYKNLSGGQKQRLSIVLALIGQPQIAVLDELTTGLDPEARRDTWQLIEAIRDGGVTIVLVTHLMEEAERLCDRVALIDHGRLIAVDRPAALASAVAGNQRVRLLAPERPCDELLRALPQVSAVEHHGSELIVTGTGDLLAAVVIALHDVGLRAQDIRPETARLEDAFLALTDDTTHTDTKMETMR